MRILKLEDAKKMDIDFIYKTQGMSIAIIDRNFDDKYSITRREEQEALE